jgi:DNA-binding transcriptional LysR family regulator
MLFSSRRDLELVRALAEHRHFGRAATALGISQPAVSRTLALLEAQVGGLLFERSTMLPTEFGRIALRVGERVLAGYADLEREIALVRGLEIGELTVAMGPYPAAISGQHAIAQLSERFPKLSIDLKLMNWTDAIDATLAGTVDLTFADVQEARIHSDLVILPVRQQTMSFVCRSGHPLTSRPELSLADVIEFPWVGPTVPSRVGTLLPQADKPFGGYDVARQRFKTRITVETFPAMIEMARHSNTIAGALPFQVEEDVREGRLCILGVSAPFLTLDYGIITRRGRTPSSAANALIQAILEIEQTWPASV